MIYFVRHCEAEGQAPEAELTKLGVQQAETLADFFADKKIDGIISSPFKRAQRSVAPLSHKLGVTIEVDERLSERVLSHKNLHDWLEKLRDSFNDVHLKLEGGESSLEAAERGLSVVREIEKRSEDNIVIVTHGNLLALMIRKFDRKFGFTEWKNLSNPDVYCLHHGRVERLWTN